MLIKNSSIAAGFLSTLTNGHLVYHLLLQLHGRTVTFSIPTPILNVVSSSTLVLLCMIVFLSLIILFDSKDSDSKTLDSKDSIPFLSKYDYD